MNPYQSFHSKPDYENPDVLSISRLPAHTRWGAFASVKEALKGDLHASSNILWLDGTYRFKLYENPQQVPAFWQDGFDDGEYADIAVPGNWQTQGFDKPVYTNTVYPWEDLEENCYIQPNAGGAKLPNPPHIPQQNPTGCYRRTFKLPVRFEGKRQVLRFEGVETAYYVWVNGKCVGFAKDSKLPSEFDITDVARPGENLLCVQVMHFADSSYLEDQDYWYLSGIFRNVMVISKPHMAIEDYKITATPDLHHLTGKLSADVTVTRANGFADCGLRMTVYDAAGERVASGAGKVQPKAEYRTDRVATANTARIEVQLDKVSMWTTETPVLYRVILELTDRAGKAIDTEACFTGFKTVEIQNGVVLLNGKRLIVYGVNRHEHAWEGGRTVSNAHMLEEIRQMKRMNINSVRTSHYPDSPDWYELCDKYGILLVCECNIETHGVAGAITHNPVWATNFVDRAMRMVCNYKNHASIYSWSLGNESGTGANHAAMYGFIKEYDPTRLCQYEAGGPGKNISDIRGNMYATVEHIVEMLCSPTDDRPIILVEYLYQISNSGGGMYKFNQLLDRFPRFQGGYVWDWQDKSLVGRTEDGKRFFAYGGDFDENMHDENCPYFMTNNGVVMPDLEWKPVAYELAQGYSPVRICEVPRDSAWDALPPVNKALFINHDPVNDLSMYRFVGEILQDGVVIKQKEMDVPSIAPLERAVVDVSIDYERKQGSRYDLNISVLRRVATFFAKAGSEVAKVQLPQYSGAPCTTAAAIAADKVQVKCENGTTTVSAGALCAVFDDAKGALTNLSQNGVTYLDGELCANFNRPISGLDCQEGWGWWSAFEPLRDVSGQCVQFGLIAGDNEVIVDAVHAYDGAYGISVRFTYRITSQGVKMDVHFDIGRAYRALLRAGIEAVVVPGFEQVSYLGYGPNENYCDRMLSATYGAHETTVEGMHFAFNPPSENGGHEGARRIVLSNASGNSLIFEMEQDAHFDAQHSRIEDYFAARHEHELAKRPETYLHIDAVHAPIGSDMAWSTGIDLTQMPSGGGYHLSLTISMK